MKKEEKIRNSIKEFEDYINLNYNKEYKLNSNDFIIIGKVKKFKITHSFCNNNYYVSKNSFINLKRRCPYCNGGISLTKEEINLRLKNEVGNEYLALEYDNSKKMWIFQHNCEKCNNFKFYTTVSRFFGKKENNQGNRCPECFQNKRYTIESFKDKVYQLEEDKYIVSSDNYINNKTKLIFKHNTDSCNFSFEMRPHDFLRGCRCPKCKASTGERKIEKYFNENKISFIHKYKDEKCKNKLLLEFDFKVFNKNGNFVYLEYDGRLHFEAWDKTKSSQEHLRKQQENDKIKNNYCKKNGIKLIRISYKENLDEKLKEYFNLNDYRKQ